MSGSSGMRYQFGMMILGAAGVECGRASNDAQPESREDTPTKQRNATN